jgi:tetratricopeptide (TPR) repeat protein
MELFEQASQLHLEKRYDEAERLYDQLLTQNHDNPGLLATMGTLYLQTERLGLAISLLERAAKLQPKGDVLCNLGIAYKHSGQYKKCREVFAEAIKHDPSADTLTNYAALFVNIGMPDEAIKHSNRALKLDPQNGMAHWNKAIGLLEKGEWESAWEEHDWGFKSVPPMRIDRGASLVPAWDGTPGKKVWVFGEQGLGDEIMFASMLPDLMKTNDVVLECHTRLKSLFEYSFPGLKCYGSRESNAIDWLDAEKPDARISIGSLGRFYRRSKELFPGTPYLKSDSAPRGEKFRVGISWTGGQKHGRVVVRSVPLAWWGSILNNDCEFVSLQYTEDAETDIETTNRLGGYSIRSHPAAKAQDYYETAQLVKSCDLVISVCTSVIHLAGALGVPCWVMVPNKPAWRYGVEGPMRWYRSVRLYRQPAGDGDAWRPVVERVGLDLNDLLDSEKQREAA